MYYHKITNVHKIALHPKNPCMKIIENTLLKLNINSTGLQSKTQKNAKLLVNQKLKEYQTNKLYNVVEKS